MKVINYLVNCVFIKFLTEPPLPILDTGKENGIENQVTGKENSIQNPLLVKKQHSKSVTGKENGSE